MAKSKISFGRILIAGILYAVIAQIIHTIGAMLSMSYYLMSDYFPVWSKLMMPSAGPPPASFMYYGIAFGLITGILLALVYSVIKGAVPGKQVYKKGIVYGMLLFLAAGVPGALSMYLLINLPAGLIWGWTVEFLVIYLLGGMAIAKIVK